MPKNVRSIIREAKLHEPSEEVCLSTSRAVRDHLRAKDLSSSPISRTTVARVGFANRFGQATILPALAEYIGAEASHYQDGGVLYWMIEGPRETRSAFELLWPYVDRSIDKMAKRAIPKTGLSKSAVRAAISDSLAREIIAETIADVLITGRPL